jgi:hypothetical protein
LQPQGGYFAVNHLKTGGYIMGWKDTGDAERFNFEQKGDELTGQLIDKKQTREYDSRVYTLVDDNDDTFYFFGCHALDARLPALIGRRVKIVYKGKRAHVKGKTIREFEISVWSEFDDSEPEDKKAKAQGSKGKKESSKGASRSKQGSE